jgi:hypothetical protein
LCQSGLCSGDGGQAWHIVDVYLQNMPCAQHMYMSCVCDAMKSAVQYVHYSKTLFRWRQTCSPAPLVGRC